MARGSRQSFTPNPGDRNKMHELPASADDLPDVVTIDLDDKDPNHVEIVEVDDTPEADRGKPTEVDDSIVDQEDDLRERVSARTRKRIDRLKFETNTQRRGREQAERERDEAVELARTTREENEQLRQRNDSSTVMLGNSMLARNESEMTSAKAKFAQAQADGDGAAMADANADIARHAAEGLAIKSRIPRAPAEGEQPQRQEPERQQPQPPARVPLAPKVETWINNNRDKWQKDMGFTNKAMSIHYALVAENIPPTDARYTQELDKRLKVVYPDHEPMDFPSDDARPERSTPRRTNAVVPGSRETDGQREPANPRTVELTRSELSIAKRLNVTPQAYALEKLKRDQREKGAA